MNVMIGCKNVKNVSDVYIYIYHMSCLNVMSCWKITFVMSYIVLSFMPMIFRCSLILCYIFMSVIIMLIGGIN